MLLNETQKKAVAHLDGPMMVLAGPGSGKTMVITHRTKNLVETHQIAPQQILVITFTRAAADEMKERFLKLIGQEDTPITFGTFHSVFYRILRQAQGLRVDQVLAEEKKYPLILNIIKTLDLEYEDESEFVHSIMLEMSYLKSELIELEHYHSTTCPHSDFRRIVTMYEKYKQERGLVDFDDMLEKSYQLLTSNPMLLSRWQGKYAYILVDEFQDINRIQYECIKLLAKPQNNLFVVGDDDQAIYEFRGAKPDFLLNFPRDFQGAKRITLSTNYRSTGLILKGSLNVIEHNQQRYQKDLETPNSAGKRPLVMGFDTAEDEADYIMDSIQKKYRENINLSDLAIIYRTHVQARFFIERLMDINIPFFVRDQLSNIFNHWIARDILAYFTLTQNIKEQEALIRIINKPKRYVNKETLLIAKAYSDNIWEGLYQNYNKQAWLIDRLEELQYHIQSLKKLRPYEGIAYIGKYIGYESYLKEYAEYRKLNENSLIEIFEEIRDSSKPYDTLDKWLQHMEDYSLELKNQQMSKKAGHNAITLTTMHSAKGLEFHTVYLTGCNEGIVPHDKSMGESGIEEERRLFYVGMTRAKEDLIMTYFNERYNKKLEVSRFIQEYKVPLHRFAIGTEIKHQQYGTGRLVKKEKDIVHIYFYSNKKTVRLSLSHCLKLDLISLNE